MKRIDRNTVELSEQELLVHEIHDLLLDQGYSQGDAMILLRGSCVPVGLRSPTPMLDKLLTPEFVDWLCQ